jgi:hypothetical protein
MGLGRSEYVTRGVLWKRGRRGRREAGPGVQAGGYQSATKWPDRYVFVECYELRPPHYLAWAMNLLLIPTIYEDENEELIQPYNEGSQSVAVRRGGKPKPS